MLERSARIPREEPEIGEGPIRKDGSRQPKNPRRHAGYKQRWQARAERTALAGVALTAADWQYRSKQIEDLLQAGAEMTVLQDKRREQVIEQAWQTDLLPVRQAWTTMGRRWWRFVFPRALAMAARPPAT